MIQPMGFFDLPEREPDDDESDNDDEEDGIEGLRPAAWIAGVVPMELVIARSDQAAVVVSRVSAYPDGFELTVSSYLHRSVKRTRRRRVHHPMMWHDMGEPGEPLPDELLRFGLEWPDGGRVTNLDPWGHSWPDATEPAHGLESRSGRGSADEYSQEYWAWPLPGPGPLSLVVEWPAFDIVETATSMDGSLLIEAAARAKPVWHEDAGRDSHVSRGAVIRSAQQRRGRAGGTFIDG
jgi:hypothetical protein